MKFLLFSIFLILINCTTEIITLNVGGKLFTTFRSTLEKAGPDSYLYKIFNSEMSKKTLDNDGNIFLDHDPETFGLLLNLLRGYDVLKGKTQDELTMLYQDANFFGKTDLMERIEEMPDEYINTPDYRGPLKRKEKHGYGFEKTADGFYEGDFVNGKRHGNGMLTKSDGTFQGEFKEGKKEGKGVVTLNTGEKIIGHYKDNQLVNGRKEWPNGDFYEGEFKDGGKKHGKGKLQSKEFTHEGYFYDDYVHGRGKRVYSDGKVENGKWRWDHFVE